MGSPAAITGADVAVGDGSGGVVGVGATPGAVVGVGATPGAVVGVAVAGKGSDVASPPQAAPISSITVRMHKIPTVMRRLFTNLLDLTNSIFFVPPS